MVDVYVLNQSLQKIYIIDYYTSLIWASRYNQLGDCELYVEANHELMNGVLVEGNFLKRADDDMICRIEKIELTTDAENGNFITAIGYDLKKILNQRIIWTTSYGRGLTEIYLRNLVRDNLIASPISARNISGFHLGALQNFTETVDEQVSYDNLGEKIAEKCVELDWGYKVSFNNGLQFDLYKGADRRQTVVFSDDYENLVSSTYTSDSTDIVNVALVGGMGEGVSREKTFVGNASGLNRSETFVDASSTTKEMTYKQLKEMYPNGQLYTEGAYIHYYKNNGAPIAVFIGIMIDDDSTAEVQHEAYINQLQSLGKQEIAQHKKTVTFEGEIEPNVTFEYKQDYLLGDLVTVENQYNIRRGARIVEVIETFDENGYTIEPRFEYKGE